MVHSSISVTVKSENQALRIVGIARNCWASAKLVRLGYLGGYFHEAQGIISVEAENESAHRSAWSRFVHEMISQGYAENIY